MTPHNLNARSERRKHPRIYRKLPIKIKADLFDLVTESQNLSLSGVYCQSDKCLGLMTKVNIVMLLPIRRERLKTVTKKVHCEGIVVRVEKSPQATDKFNLAVFFNRITKANRDIISRYIESHREENSASGVDNII